MFDRPINSVRNAFLIFGFVFLSTALFGQTETLAGPFTNPTALESLPDGRLLVVQKNGSIFQVKEKTTSPWGDFSDSTVTDQEAGFLGIVSDPNFEANGYLYATQSYSENGKIFLRLLRLRDNAGKGVINRVLLDRLTSGSEHPGGVVKIGPDGKIYLGIGDGGDAKGAGKPENGLGVLFRLNLDGSVPADNPVANSPLWAWGFRDPRGLAWSPTTGKLYELDRGPGVVKGTMDSLNLVERNRFYGWPLYKARDWASDAERPIIYCSSGHSWVPGGAIFVVNSSWHDSLLFAGNGEGNLYRLSLDQKNPHKITFYEELVNGSLGPLVDIVQSQDGKLFLLSKDTVYEFKAPR